LYRDYFGINDADRPEEAREKISKGVLGLDPELEASLPLLFDFLEVPDLDRPSPQLAPDVRMRQLFAAIRRITARRSEREVLLLVAEDLHWFDPQSEAFLERLIESFPGSRTLVVANFRPEFSAAWMRHSYYRQLPLAPLREQAVSDLLGGLLGVDLSLSPLVSFVLERTAGNPFFIEEVVRSLVEDGTLAGEAGRFRLTCSLHEVDVPPRVQAVLAARIDRLPEREKHLLQAAAVIGRTFSQPLLRQVVDLAEDDLDVALSDLCAAEFIQEESGYPLYRFWHPLTQDVAYQGLLTEHRARLHAAAARAIVELESERLDQLAALVAFHWDRAGDHHSAAVWEARAANWVSFRDPVEAVRRWRAALDHVASLPDDVAAAGIGLQARSQLIRIGSRAGMSEEETEKLFIEAQGLAKRFEGQPPHLRLLQARGTERFLRGQIIDGLATYSDAERLGADGSDPDSQAVICAAISVATPYVGPLSRGFAAVQQTVALTNNDPARGFQYLGFSPLIRSLLHHAELEMLAGRLPEAHRGAGEIAQRAQQRQEAELQAWALTLFAAIAELSGTGATDAARKASEAVRITEETGNIFARIVALQAKALSALLEGRFDEAAAVSLDALAESRTRALGLSEESKFLIILARARAALSDSDGAKAAIDEAVERARATGFRVGECRALLNRANIQRLKGFATSAGDPAEDLRHAFTLVNDTEAVVYEPFIREELGRLRDEESDLREALRLYRQIGATGHACRLEAELR
jgi:hypothetical protein